MTTPSVGYTPYSFDYNSFLSKILNGMNYGSQSFSQNPFDFGTQSDSSSNFGMPFDFSSGQMPFSLSDYIKESRQERIEANQKEAKESQEKLDKLKKEKEAAEKALSNIKADKKPDGTVDEKKSDVSTIKKFGSALKNFGKGALKCLTGLVCDDKGFSWKRLGTTVAVGAGIVALEVATGGAATPALISLGAAMGGMQVTKGVADRCNAKTDEEKAKAWQEMGEGTGTLGLSVIGLRTVNAAKSVKAGELAESLNVELNKIPQEKINPSLVEDIKTGIEALKNTKGKKTNIENAKSDLKDLSDKHPELTDFNAMVREKMSNSSRVFEKGSLDKLSARCEESSLNNEQNEKMTEIIVRLKTATNSKDALNAIKDAKTLLKDLKDIDCSQIKVLLTQAERQAKIQAKPINIIKSKIRENKAVETAKTTGQAFKEYPYRKSFGRLAIADAVTFVPITGFADKIHQQSVNERIEKDSAPYKETLEKAEAEEKELKQEQLEKLQATARLLDIPLTDGAVVNPKDKTADELQKEIDKKTGIK